MIKHNLVLLSTHSLNVANIALVIARQLNQPLETQTSSWWFGLVHDSGWYNLEIVGSMHKRGYKNYKHDKVTPGTVKLLLRECSVKKPEISIEHLVTFANLHAKGHYIDSARIALGNFLKKNGYNPMIRYIVTQADRLSTSLEKPGYLSNVSQIITNFTSNLTIEVNPKKVNLLRLLAHSELQQKFKERLIAIEKKLSKETTTNFESLLAEWALGLVFVLPVREKEQLWRSFTADISTMEIAEYYSHEELIASLLGKQIAYTRSCIFCNNSSKYIKNLHHFNKTIYRSGLGLIGEFWDGKPRVQKGICPACLYSTRRELSLKGIQMIIALPKLNPINYREERFLKACNKWEKLVRERKCKPNPIELITYSKNNPLIRDKDKWITKFFADLDTLREAYNDAVSAYEETIKIVEELETSQLERKGTVTLVQEVNLCHLADKLVLKENFAPILIDSLKLPRRLGVIQIGGFSLVKEMGLEGLRLLELSKNQAIKRAFFSTTNLAEAIVACRPLHGKQTILSVLSDIEAAEQAFPIIASYLRQLR